MCAYLCVCDMDAQSLGTSAEPSSVRLFGLDTLSSERQLGIVEFLTDNRWGVLCRPTDTEFVGEAICQGFGFRRDEAELSTLTSTQ